MKNIKKEIGTNAFYLQAKFNEITEIKEQTGKIIIEGYASTNDVDRGNDIVIPEAFESSLGDYLNNNPSIFLQHKDEKVIGKCLEGIIDQKGLKVKVEINNNIDDVIENIKKGNLNTFSIGFIPKKFIFKLNNEELGNQDGLFIQEDTDLDAFFEKFYNKDVIRTIQDLELLEISVVGTPMNGNAIFALKKSMELNIDKIKKELEEKVKNIKEKNEEEIVDIKEEIKDSEVVDYTDLGPISEEELDEIIEKNEEENGKSDEKEEEKSIIKSNVNEIIEKIGDETENSSESLENHETESEEISENDKETDEVNDGEAQKNNNDDDKVNKSVLNNEIVELKKFVEVKDLKIANLENEIKRLKKEIDETPVNLGFVEIGIKTNKETAENFDLKKFTTVKQ